MWPFSLCDMTVVTSDSSGLLQFWDVILSVNLLRIKSNTANGRMEEMDGEGEREDKSRESVGRR